MNARRTIYQRKVKLNVSGLTETMDGFPRLLVPAPAGTQSDARGSAARGFKPVED